MSEPSLAVSRRGSVSWARIDRPAVLGALDAALLDRLLAWLRDGLACDDIRVLCLTGTGRAFSAGADIREMDGLDEAGFAANTQRYQTLARLCHGASKPVIAAVNGLCLGGGMELACMCDLRVAGASARFGLPDAALGFSVSGGLSWFLPRQTGAGRAMELYLTGRMIDADEARRIGLVAEVAEDGELVGRVQAMAERVAAQPPAGFAHFKALLHAAHPQLEAALADEEDRDRACFANPQVRSRLRAFLAERRRAKLPEG